MAEVGGGLPRLLSHHQQLRVDGPEGVDDHLALHALDGVNDDCDRARVQLLEGLVRQGGMAWPSGGNKTHQNTGMHANKHTHAGTHGRTHTHA